MSGKKQGYRGKATKQELARQAVEDWERLYDDAPVGLCVMDADLRYLRVNRRFVELTGQPLSKYLGKTLAEVDPAVLAQTRRLYRQLVATGLPIHDIEYLRDDRTRPGTERSWVAHWFPIKDAQGRVIAVNIAFVESTERKRAEAERDKLIETLDAERARLTTVLEQMPAGVIIVEAPSGRSLFGNKESSRIFRHPFRPAEEIAQYGHWKLYRPDGSALPEVEYPLARAVLHGETVTGEELLIERGDGTRGVISANAAPVRDRRRKIVAAVVTFFDITVQRETLDALRESESKFRKIAENSPFGLGAYTSDGRITFMNRKLTEIVGYRSRDVPLLNDWFRQAYPDARYRREVETQWAADIARVEGGKLPHSPVREYRFVCRGGEVKTLEITFALGLGVTYAMFNDVTERKDAEKALHEATEFMSGLLECAPLPIYVRDAGHRYRLVNREWERVFGMERGEVIGRSIEEVLPRGLARALSAANRKVLAGGRAVSVEESISFPEGRHTFHTVKFPLRNSARKVDAVGGISIDMTERIRAQEEVLRLNEELEKRVIARTQELAVANRELRRENTERVRLERELTETSEREQRRLGEGLHDELGQQLTGLGMMVSAFEQQLSAAGYPHAKVAAEIGEILRNAVASTRDLAKGFYPILLEQGGLLEALQDLAHRTRSVAGVPCIVRRLAGFRFRKESAIHIYRIAQEAVSNALRHGNPREIKILLTTHRGQSVLRIVNDGRDFKPPAVENRSMGMHLMRYRARFIGADVSVGRGPQGGCEVVCTLGVSREVK